MAWFLGQSLLFVGLAFLLGLLVGWLIWGRVPRPSGNQLVRHAVAEQSVSESTPEPMPKPEPVAEAEAEPVGEPEPVAIEAEPIADAEPVAVEAEPEPVVVVEPEPVAEPVAVAEAEPIAEAEPVVVEPVPVIEAEPDVVARSSPVTADSPITVDNLQRIEGIGPKISTVLIAAEITTFGDLAATDLDTLTEVLRRGGVRFAPSMSTWPTQADLLANGDEAGFRALTSQLVAGRRAR